MGLYTNEGLVKHCEKALALKTKYMWGGLLREITPAYIKQLRGIYKTTPGTGYTEARYRELEAVANKGCYGVDCVGLVKSYYWSGKADGGTGSPNYNAPGYPDVNATMMFNMATRKGRISTLPERPGVIVYSKTHPHVGVYIGGGYTIESTLGNRGDGVVKRKLDSFWEYWFECPYIKYKAKPTSGLKAVILAYNAAVRDRPATTGNKLGVLAAGTKCVIENGSETVDPVSKYKYVKLAGDREQWIVKTAIK